MHTTQNNYIWRNRAWFSQILEKWLFKPFTLSYSFFSWAMSSSVLVLRDRVAKSSKYDRQGPQSHEDDLLLWRQTTILQTNIHYTFWWWWFQQRKQKRISRHRVKGMLFRWGDQEMNSGKCGIWTEIWEKWGWSARAGRGLVQAEKTSTGGEQAWKVRDEERLMSLEQSKQE